MSRVIVTAGAPYVDVDAFGGAVAYAELLRAQGQDALAVSTAPINESITPHLFDAASQFTREYDPRPDDRFTLVDVSDEGYFDTFVDVGRVATIIDHHVGFEQRWEDQIGEEAHIEFVGAACTLVYELWQQSGKLAEMSKGSAELLVAGILDNTLNFGAKITTERDHEAFRELSKVASIDESWIEAYFKECQQTIEQDVTGAIAGDTKIVPFQTFEHPVSLGQLVLWDGQEFIDRESMVMRDALKALKPQWCMNLISLKDGASYLLSDDKLVQEWVSNLLGVEFSGDVAQADRMWLRKEIIKADQEKAN